MKYGALALLILAAVPALAQSDEKDLEELLSVVQQETQLATKSKMNSDYVPGIVTVLDGDDLEALGITNAGEALGLIPGMLAARDLNGTSTVIVRGLDFPFNSGNIQIQVNSIPLVRADAGSNSAALLIPIEQIDRIEVIRGPGSVVYGDYAFMGLVNIITRGEGTRLFARASTPHATIEAGARHAWHSFALNVAGTTSDNTELATSGSDDRRLFAVAQAQFGDLGFAAEVVRRDLHNATGAIVNNENSAALEAKYAHAITPALNATVRASWLHNRLVHQVTMAKGDVGKLAAEFSWNGLKHQSWLIGADYSRSTIDDAFFRLPPPPGQPLGPFVRLVHDKSRGITGITLQDRVDLGKALALTLGARYDSYSDFDDRITPRVAIVWRASDRHILKAQYTEGFRPPTFFELYSTPPPGSTPRYAFEVNATTEVNYVYRAANSVGRATIFRSILSNMIRPGGVLTDPNARAEGIELEWSQQIAPSIKLDANVSYVDTIDPRQPGPDFPEEENPIAPPWLANLSLFYRPMHGLVLAGRWNYGADTDRVDGRNLFDITVSREDVFAAGLDLRAGVKNVFDTELNSYTVLPSGTILTTAFPRRSVFVQLSWKR